MGQRRTALLFLGLIVSTAFEAAAARPRTPAELEQRRQAIEARLTAIDSHCAALAAALADLHQRRLAAEASTVVNLEAEQRGLDAAVGRLEEERASLRQEQSELARVPTRSASGPLQPADPRGLRPLDLQGAGQTSSGSAPASAFNPAISVIPDFAYYNDNAQGEAIALTEQADGFAVRGPADSASHDGLERGFNLREAEVAFSGAVDPYFDVWATFAVSRDGIEAEEVYLQTRRLLPGLQLRAGHFFSGIGYVNKQHPHQWDFVDRPLPLAAILGGTLAETGVQVTWLPPLPTYVLMGFEALQGENERLANQLGSEGSTPFPERAGPRLFSGFLKVAPDMGFSNILQVGASLGRSRSQQEGADVLEAEGWDGAAWLAGTDAVWRHDSGKAYGVGDVALQAEYFFRRKWLDAVAEGQQPIGAQRRVATGDGLYAQAVYGFAPRWMAAGRFDVVGWSNRLDRGSDRTFLESSNRASAAVTFNPTEFSRLRVQYSRGRVSNAGSRQTFDQVFVQLQMSLGAHGAHAF